MLEKVWPTFAIEYTLYVGALNSSPCSHVDSIIHDHAEAGQLEQL